jgi:hypothetical protein
MDMQITFYLTADPQDEGRRFLHTEGCQIRQHHLNGTVELGTFGHCAEALEEARKTHPRTNGCALCAPDCHTPHDDMT